MMTREEIASALEGWLSAWDRYDLDGVVALAKRESVDLVVVGPDGELAPRGGPRAGALADIGIDPSVRPHVRE